MPSLLPDTAMLTMSSAEMSALRHLLVWLQGVEAAGGATVPEAFVAEFTAAELDILAGLRRVFLEFEFQSTRPGAR